MSKERLQKVLAGAGVASRRQCEELILQGVVSVNRQVVDTLPAFVDTEKDVITVAGRRIAPARKVYFLLNKPKGVPCTSRDTHGPPGGGTAVDLVRSPERTRPELGRRIFCVGMLDADTSGVLILTNDSVLANRLTHPKYQVPKTYQAKVKGQVTDEAVEKLNKGVWLAEGKATVASVKVLKRSRAESLVEVTITQGLNRQVLRMLAKVGLRVKSLRRTAIGKLTVKGLALGDSRPLTKAEIEHLKRLSSG
jgi:pseudouridine synthase